jgi:hypothetical protein
VINLRVRAFAPAFVDFFVGGSLLCLLAIVARRDHG